MLPHGNRSTSRSTARSAARIGGCTFLALIICGGLISLRQPEGPAFNRESTQSGSLLTSGSGAPADKFSSDGAGGGLDRDGGSSSGSQPGVLMHQDRHTLRALEELDLSACLGQEGVDDPMTQEQFLAQTPARLRLEHMRLSPLKSPVSVTLVTTYDISRLHMLEGLCSSWGGHLSAAVYQGVTNPEERNKSVQWSKYRIDDIWKRAKQRKHCAMDIALWSEILAPEDPWMSMLFPVNSLRSRALLMARTELVFVLDGDMLVHAGLHSSLAAQPERQDRLLLDAQNKVYRVLAAFQTPDLDMAYDVAEGAKPYAVDMFQQKKVTRFNPEHAYPQGCTDYDRWQTAEEPYSITYCKRYEPWGIVSRQLMPWFDVRFRGYGRNKIIFAAALNSSDFSFVVDDVSYVIHRPHEATKGSVAFSSDARLQGHVVSMYLEQARAGNFTPVVDDALLRCKAHLPWWKWGR